MAKERLQKVLAHAGVASRRRAEDLILSGRVAVDGFICTTLGVRVDPERQVVTVDGKPIRREHKVTYMLHKPIGVVSTVRDPQGRTTVRELLKDVAERIYPVGRLDTDTSGLLLLSNDGELVHRLTHPRYEVEKVYHATVEGLIDDEAVAFLARGVRLDDGLTAPAKVSVLWRRQGKSLVKLSIHEGRNRQVRRMFEAVGYPVIALERIRFAFLTLQGLRAGQYRQLTDAEVRRLRSLVGLEDRK